jgi:hypothetical protein
MMGFSRAVVAQNSQLIVAVHSRGLLSCADFWYVKRGRGNLCK